MKSTDKVVTSFKSYYTALRAFIDRSDPRVLMWIFPLLYIGVFIITSLLRIGFPYQLSWLEGAMVDNARWVLNGNQLYGPPSVEFTPFFYPPFYSYLSALLMKIFGVNILVPRIISLLSTVLTLVLVQRLVLHETGSRFHSVLAAGFYASFYHFVRCYYDMARVDALFIAMLFLGVYILRTGKKNYSIYLSAAAFYLAIFTKQQTLVVVIILGIVLLFEDFKKLVKLTLTFSILCFLTFLYFQYASDGWFLYYIYKFPNSHGIHKVLVPLIFQDLLLHAPVLLFIGPYFFFKSSGGDEAFRSRRRFYLALYVATFTISWVSRAHPGGVENVVMPVLLCLSILGAISFWYFEQDLGKTGKRSKYFVAMLIMAHFLILIYNPASVIPKQIHYDLNKKLVNLIASFEGDVLVTQFGYIPILAGKETHTHKTAIFYSTSRGDVSNEARRIIDRAFRKAIRQKRFSAIILRHKEAFFLQKMKGHYKKKGRFKIPQPLVLHGVMHTYWDIYVPK